MTAGEKQEGIVLSVAIVLGIIIILTEAFM